MTQCTWRAQMLALDYINRESAPLRDRKKAILEDASLFEPERQKRLHEVRSEADNLFRQKRSAIEAIIEEARLEMIRNAPAMVAESAAFANPARFYAVKQMATGAPANVLERLSKLALKDQDAAAAHAIRQAAGELARSGVNVQPIMADLGKIGAEPYARAMADLVGAQSQLATLSSRGAFGDFAVLLENPAEVLRAANEVGIVPTNDMGGTKSLTTADVETLRSIAGVPIGTQEAA